MSAMTTAEERLCLIYFKVVKRCWNWCRLADSLTCEIIIIIN